MKETKSQAHALAEEEGKVAKSGKHKLEYTSEDDGKKKQEYSAQIKKAKVGEGDSGDADDESSADVAAKFEEFCKLTRQHLSIEQMRKILEANGQDPSGSDDAVVPRCQDMIFYGPLERCPVCRGQLECTGNNYLCKGIYSEWTTCVYTTRESPPRKNEVIKIPDDIVDETTKEWVKRTFPLRSLTPLDKPLSGITISLSGRLSRRHQDWKKEVEKNGGKVSGNIIGVNCLIVSAAERERGGSAKVAEAMERNIPVVREAWLVDSIGKGAPRPLDEYDLLSDLAPEGQGIPWDKQDPSEEALESLTAELKLYGKRSVHKDSKLVQLGGSIFERDEILYNCAFSICDQGSKMNEYCILQLIEVPEKNLHIYYKNGRVGNDPRANERVEEQNSEEDAIKEFVRMFHEITGNEFEPWEREKKFQKRHMKFHPIDMDEGFDVRHGGLGLRQLGAAAMHCKLDSFVSNLMKVLCSQEIYRYALMEMGYDSPDLPIGMLSSFHLERCERELVEFQKAIRTEPKSDAQAATIQWMDFSNKWFTLMHSSRPFLMGSFQEFADHAASAYEAVRDINVASRLIGDMSGATIDDPLSDSYRKLGCSITPVEKESDDYKMIVKYLNTTYEPNKVGDVMYGISVENIYTVESSTGPSFKEIMKKPNKILLWCGTRTCNVLRHLQKGLLPAVCQIPVAGYMFGKAIVCSDAAAEAARYGFTSVDRPEGFLFLGVVSLGDETIEISSPVDNTKQWEEKRVSVKGLGKKKTDESEHFTWMDGVKVPCGHLIESENKDSVLEYNEYAVYDSNQVCMRFLVEVKQEEQNVEMVAEEP